MPMKCAAPPWRLLDTGAEAEMGRCSGVSVPITSRPAPPPRPAIWRAAPPGRACEKAARIAAAQGREVPARIETLSRLAQRRPVSPQNSRSPGIRRIRSRRAPTGPARAGRSTGLSGPSIPPRPVPCRRQFTTRAGSRWRGRRRPSASARTSIGRWQGARARPAFIERHHVQLWWQARRPRRLGRDAGLGDGLGTARPAARYQSSGSCSARAPAWCRGCHSQDGRGALAGTGEIMRLRAKLARLGAAVDADQTKLMLPPPPPDLRRFSSHIVRFCSDI